MSSPMRWCPRCTDTDVAVEAREPTCFACGSPTTSGRAPRGRGITSTDSRVWEWHRDDPEVGQ